MPSHADDDRTRPPDPGAACDLPAAPVDPMQRMTRALPAPLLRPLLDGADALYVGFQGILKSFGFVPPGGPAPEEVRDGRRWARLEEVPGRWPSLEAPLPGSAVFMFPIEGMLRRGALWQCAADPEQVEAAARAAAAGWPEVRERRRGEVLELFSERDGVRGTLKVAAPTGADAVVLSLGQKRVR